ncbi:MAG TPA: ribosome-recycling factor, partial [Spirochaetota bacterium]|nr:ribosome-recycling factor [Spirochaetota bacterium]
KKKNEDCKISIRNIRREANDQVKKQEKDKEISEDELNDSLEEIQKITDSYVTKIDDTTENKINEITTI